jgi:hypothetical protein
VDALKTWLAKSQAEKNGSAGSIATYAPIGVNCRKLIKDLNKALKRAEKLIEGQIKTGKKRKGHKSFELNDNANSTSELKHDMNSDSDERKLVVVDEELKLRIKRTERVLSSDSHGSGCESKGVIKMKLSLCGKSGLPEVTGATLTPPASASGWSHSHTMDEEEAMHSEYTLTRIGSGLADNSHLMQTCSSALEGRASWQSMRSSASLPLHTLKKAKLSQDLPEDQEILDMIKDRPEDGDFIYLDVETGVDEEDGSMRGGRNKPVARDDAWIPRARVVITGAPKAARPVRENAKREVVESSIANAAAKLEHVTHVKRAYNRRKPRKSQSASSGDADSSRATATGPQSQVITANNEQSVFEFNIETGSSESKAGPSNSSEEAAAALKAKKANKPRKGEKTAKQRLAKILKLRK